MLGTIGCYIRYDYSLRDVKINNHTAVTVSTISATSSTTSTSSAAASTSIDSVISCAESCFYNPECESGWSYEVATKRCFLFKTANLTMVQPGSILNALFNNLGWVSGLKSCKAGNE